MEKLVAACAVWRRGEDVVVSKQKNNSLHNLFFHIIRNLVLRSKVYNDIDQNDGDYSLYEN